MRTRATLWIIPTVVLCLASFIVGRWSGSRGVITYSVDGETISFNRKEMHNGLQLAQHENVLALLRAGDSTNAIAVWEDELDAETYDAICLRPLLQGYNLKGLDLELAAVARYRKQYPRDRGTDTNVFWYWQGKQVDTFLHDFPKK